MKEKLLEVLVPALEDIDVSIYDISFEKEDGVDTLFIKLDGSVDTDTCEQATKVISPIVDELNIIEGEYVLDVCSKGEENE